MPHSRARIVAVDYGRARLGIASSDSSGRIALPSPTIHISKRTLPGAVEAAQLGLKAFVIDQLVVGLPLELTGREGPMAKEAREFGVALASALSVPVVFYDERFSSKIAEADLRHMGLNRKERQRCSDSTAACQLLQEYLDRQPPTSSLS